MPLTDTFLRSLKPNGKSSKHADFGGLYLYLSLSYLEHRRGMLQKWADYLDGLRTQPNLPLERAQR